MSFSFSSSFSSSRYPILSWRLHVWKQCDVLISVERRHRARTDRRQLQPFAVYNPFSSPGWYQRSKTQLTFCRLVVQARIHFRFSTPPRNKLKTTYFWYTSQVQQIVTVTIFQMIFGFSSIPLTVTVFIEITATQFALRKLTYCAVCIVILANHGPFVLPYSRCNLHYICASSIARNQRSSHYI